MKRILVFLFLGFPLVGFSQSYTLSSDSKLTIDGTSTIHDWTVTANKIEGSLEAQDGIPTEITFEVSVAEIISERGATMDKKMHDALKQEDHPKVYFKLQDVKDTSTLVGTISIAGVEKSVEVNVEMISKEDLINFKGSKKIILQDFEMEPPTAMFGQIVVGDEVTVNFDLVFKI